ncbi:hypothetical protein KUTeg_015933 [Tegillarca granosa]|uniref:Uncharacterized protein n=1 Tax=Tegillarca granosa TaxID=220873 RepID=A0ABQ9EJD9_TEGGR|nr:hypothetical protein KUTeg_015933 [Tegillarca granosa]
MFKQNFENGVYRCLSCHEEDGFRSKEKKGFNKAEHRQLLKNFLGMLDQIENIIEKSDCDKHLRDLAEKLYVVLTQTDQTPLKDSFNISQTKVRTGKSKSSSKTKHIILQIKGMIDKSDRELLMRLLLQVKGVVSITFDLNKKRCILRTKQEVKPEVLISFGTNMKEVDKENTTLPDYLPDIDSPKADSKSLARNDKGQEKQSGWLTSAVSFISNSFYW